jgi:uncharacterized membrane protein (DUF373 family)
MRLGERIARNGEIIVVAVSGLLVLAAVMFASGTLVVLFADGVRANIGSVDTIAELQNGVQRVFAGVLLLMLGLELLETLKAYFTESQIRIEVILIVALIAVARHVMLLDIEHANADVLLGSAALTLALAASYWLVKWRRAGPAAEGD